MTRVNWPAARTGAPIVPVGPAPAAPPGALPIELTADQQIRTTALHEAAVFTRRIENLHSTFIGHIGVLELAVEFEAYIRDGVA